MRIIAIKKRQRLYFDTEFSSVAQLSPILCDPMDCSMLGLPVHHQLPEFTQIHVHWVGDATWPSHPLSPSFPSALNLSQRQGLFQWISSSHQVTKGVELQLQHQSFQWIFRVDFLYNWLVWSPCSSRDSEESSLVQKHQFFSTQPSLLSSSHICTWLLERP